MKWASIVLQFHNVLPSLSMTWIGTEKIRPAVKVEKGAEIISGCLRARNKIGVMFVQIKNVGIGENGL